MVLEIPQDTQLMRNEHPGAFASPLLQWKSDKYYVFRVCACTLNYPAFTTYLPHCVVICGLDGRAFFSPHFMIKGTIFGEKVTEHKICVLIFFTTFSQKRFSFEEEQSGLSS